MGVRRAVDLAVDAAQKPEGGILTLGPLIHNEQTLAMLRSRGVEPLGEDAPPPGGRILVRAHGVPPDVESAYREDGYRILDGTCPKVKTVHRVISRLREKGCAVVIAGDPGHAEVRGLLGYSGDAGRLVESPADVARLPELGPCIGLVSQTTFHRETFDRIAAALRERFPEAEIRVRKTICAATDRRQRETDELARRVDAMIVVGGRHSANTLRLAEIARRHCAEVQHVEEEGEIDGTRLEGCGTVGVTAGASTPNWMINRVVEHLYELDRRRSRSLGSRLSQVLDALSHMNVFTASGAAAMYYSSCVLQGRPFVAAAAFTAFLYFLSMYLWNSLTNLESTRHLGIGRYRFYDAHRRYLYALVAVGAAGLLGLGAAQHGSFFRLMLLATVAGSLYHVPLVPGRFRRILKYRAIVEIPTSRDFFVALAWSVVITLSPHALEGRFEAGASTVFFMLWMFFLAYLRSLVLDLRDIQGDRILGRETLVTIIGGARVRRLVRGLSVAAAATLTVVGGYGLVAENRPLAAFLSQLPVLAYIGLVMGKSRRLSEGRPVLFKLVIDGLFFVSALGAGAWRLLA